ncbi:lytic murein transglycosylase B [Marinobacteraceae bacterium S3BR75-40.1]
MTRLVLTLSLLLWGLFPGTSLATPIDSGEVRAFIDYMHRTHAFPVKSLEAWLAAAEKKDSILEAISRPAEKVLSWKDYRRIFLTRDRIEKGHQFLVDHADTFARVEDELGVAAPVVAAIIGVETRYGGFTGRYRVIDALSTLAFHYPPRAPFFRDELEQYLLLSREQGFDPLTLKGSYAGAMGYGQFISSSYRAYAVDFDHDGTADILSNPTDAIGSVANYFKRHGWHAGEPVAQRLQQPGKALRQLAVDRAELKPQHTLVDLKEAGARLSVDLPADAPVNVLSLEGEDGREYWATFHNFYVITRYNHSNLYAMAVHNLARALAREPEEEQ